MRIVLMPLQARILRVLAGMHYVQETGVDAFVATPVTEAFTSPTLQACNIHWSALRVDLSAFCSSY